MISTNLIRTAIKNLMKAFHVLTREKMSTTSLNPLDQTEVISTYVLQASLKVPDEHGIANSTRKRYKSKSAAFNKDHRSQNDQKYC